MLGVMSLRPTFVAHDQFSGHDRVAAPLEASEYLAGEPARHRIGLTKDQGLFDSHSVALVTRPRRKGPCGQDLGTL